MNVFPTTSTPAPTPILDYAPTHPPGRAGRWIILFVAGLLGGAAGAAAGFMVTPVRYRAIGYVQAIMPNLLIGFGTSKNDDRWDKLRDEKRELFSRMRGSTTRNLVVSRLVADGMAHTTARQVANQVEYRDIPESRLIAVMTEDSNAVRAAHVANTAMRVACGVGSVGSDEDSMQSIQIIRPATIPAGTRHPLPSVLSGLLGFAAGIWIFRRRLFDKS